MTKVRPPLTFENALSQVAGVIGWKAVAGICGFAENTVRNWSDHDTTARLPLESALRLDVAYQAAGGDSSPFLLCYSTRIDLALQDLGVDRRQLIASAARAAKESGEAIAATLAAADPNATPADFIVAEREIEEAIGANRTALCIIQRLARRCGNDPQPGAEAPGNATEEQPG